MDLRGKLSAQQIEVACRVLDYQPFFLTDDLQTGAAYSWAYGVDLRNPALLYRKQTAGVEWAKITDSNARLRRMYDDFMTAIADRYKGGSYLDFACNNGYFPVKAQQLGMRETFGTDRAPILASSMRFLNEVLGTDAEFILANYEPGTHTAPISGKYDVVSASAILCHLPDPVNFLAFLGSLANEAIFYFGQVVETDALIVSYFKPHPSLGAPGKAFPYLFNDVTRLSRGLLYHGFEEMGFKNIIELPWSSEWLSPYFYVHQREPELAGETRDEVQHAWKLNAELTMGSKHVAVLAMR